MNERFIVECDDGPDISFRGKLLAEVVGNAFSMVRLTDRTTTLRIYRTVGNNYIFTEDSCSIEMTYPMSRVAVYQNLYKLQSKEGWDSLRKALYDKCKGLSSTIEVD